MLSVSLFLWHLLDKKRQKMFVPFFFKHVMFYFFEQKNKKVRTFLLYRECVG